MGVWLMKYFKRGRVYRVLCVGFVKYGVIVELWV